MGNGSFSTPRHHPPKCMFKPEYNSHILSLIKKVFTRTLIVLKIDLLHC